MLDVLPHMFQTPVCKVFLSFPICVTSLLAFFQVVTGCTALFLSSDLKAVLKSSKRVWTSLVIMVVTICVHPEW